MPARNYRQKFCLLYSAYNQRQYVHPDPLEFLYSYDDLHDREIVALVASSLAYGNVSQILKAVSVVLKRLDSPYEFLSKASPDLLFKRFIDFKYRFTTGEELARMLFGVKLTVERYGSLGACFLHAFRDDHDNVVPALSFFVKELSRVFDKRPRSLLPSPDSGSACKRLNLFLRWMVRRDEVDPGGWDDVPKSKLIIPLDVHMHRISLGLRLTNRKQASLRTAIEITSAFKIIEPEDPVRYDFALARLGIRKDLSSEDFLRECGILG